MYQHIAFSCLSNHSEQFAALNPQTGYKKIGEN